MERDLGEFREASAKWLTKYTRLERIHGVAAGILIGVGVGGWVALGMSPWQALTFSAIGSSFALGGLGMEITRRSYKEYRDKVLSEK